MKYNCLKCGTPLDTRDLGLYLTSYPIDWIFVCPNCEEENYILAGNIQCTAEDYINRIHKYYDDEE